MVRARASRGWQRVPWAGARHSAQHAMIPQLVGSLVVLAAAARPGSGPSAEPQANAGRDPVVAPARPEPGAGDEWNELTPRRTRGVEEGLPESPVTDGVAARERFRWVASPGGPARFDGVGFKTRGVTTPGFETARVSSLAERAPGQPVIGTGDGLFLLEDGRFERLHATDSADPTAPGTGSGEAWVGGRGLLVGLALAVLGYGLHRARVRALRDHGLALQAEIRDRRAAEEERRRAEEQLRESTKLEAVGRLAGGIAHDFNNLLTTILGHVELLRGRAELLTPEEVREQADSIEACSSKAESLTQQLLAFSRRQVLRPRVIDVNGIVLGLEKLLTRLLPETLELIIDTSPEAGCVRADPSQLEQVVMNLVLNARDASPEGGELTVETRRETLVEDGEVRHFAVVSVSDQGRGIHPDDLPHVFEPFFTTKGASGTGLGLASVHGIVVQSGGRVVVESEPGRGATFRVLLPAVLGLLPELEEEHIPLDEHRGNETVLVCDDYDPVRSVTRRTLELYGYDVLVADHPERALEVARRSPRPVALLVTDFAMPGMTGRELADRMLFEQPQLRVLFISGYTTNVALRRQVVDEEVAFLPKPFAPEGLARKVREVLDGQRAPDPA